MPPVPGHGQFLDQISVKTYVGTGSFYCEMCPRKLGHAQFQKRDYTAEIRIELFTLFVTNITKTLKVTSNYIPPILFSGRKKQILL